jgi:hypothetical protein
MAKKAEQIKAHRRMPDVLRLSMYQESTTNLPSVFVAAIPGLLLFIKAGFKEILLKKYLTP